MLHPVGVDELGEIQAPALQRPGDVGAVGHRLPRHVRPGQVQDQLMSAFHPHPLPGVDAPVGMSAGDRPGSGRRDHDGEGLRSGGGEVVLALAPVAEIHRLDGLRLLLVAARQPSEKGGGRYDVNKLFHGLRMLILRQGK